MHTVHHTDAFILKSIPAKEANRLVWLFTRDFGLVVATVQGVRKQGAKLQMQLSEYALISADLVRGKEVWRLVSAHEINNPFIGKDPNGLGRAYVRTLSAVERFCQGEEAHPELFEHLEACIGSLSEKDIDTAMFDTLSLWKVLTLLGYNAITDEDQQFFDLPIREAVGNLDERAKKRLVTEMNETIKETHL